MKKTVLFLVTLALAMLTVHLMADTTATAQALPSASPGLPGWLHMILYPATALLSFIGGLFKGKDPNAVATAEGIAAATAPLVAKALGDAGQQPASAIVQGIGQLAVLAQEANNATAHVTQNPDAPHAAINGANQQNALANATAALVTAAQAVASAPKS